MESVLEGFSQAEMEEFAFDKYSPFYNMSLCI